MKASPARCSFFLRCSASVERERTLNAPFVNAAASPASPVIRLCSMDMPRASLTQTARGFKIEHQPRRLEPVARMARISVRSRSLTSGSRSLGAPECSAILLGMRLIARKRGDA